MKLLGWLHRKFQQNNNGSLKYFPLGHPSTCHSGPPSSNEKEPNCRSRSSRHAEKGCLAQKSFSQINTVRVEEDDLEKISSDEIFYLFHSLLTIGTLGLDPVVSRPATPTFGILVKGKIEGTEVSQKHSKQIKNELEKVLAREAEDEERSSRCSKITTNSSNTAGYLKQIKAIRNDVVAREVLQRQETLSEFRSQLLEQKTATTEHRPTLGELFERSKTANPPRKNEKEEKIAEKRDKKQGVPLAKKILMGRMHNKSSSKGTKADKTSNSFSSEMKRHKMQQIFHRKVHPESSMAAKQATKSSKCSRNITIPCYGAFRNGDQMLPEEDINEIPKKYVPKGTIQYYKSHYSCPSIPSQIDPTANKECWIDTDSEYLVLEL